MQKMELKHDGHDLARWMYEQLTGKPYDEYITSLKERGFAIEVTTENNLYIG